MQFSANLGFLWTDQSLPKAIYLAANAGFDAVECHWPYEVPAEDILAALRECGLAMLSLNTRRGHAGENGLLALQGRETEARASLEEAFGYGAQIGAGMVHAMAGIAAGDAARACYVDNLIYACDLASMHNMQVLIEPLNPKDAPGYFLQSTGLATEIITQVGRPELRLMFDFYHQQINEGDLIRSFDRLQPMIGHIQIAAVPSRGRPDQGEVDFSNVLAHVKAAGWTRPIGAEYRPDGPTEASLGWLPVFRDILPAKMG